MTIDMSPERSEIVHTTSQVDFAETPNVLEPYEFGHPITRENFVNFLIDSFSKSRGNIVAQAYQWVWLGRNSGIDVPNLIKNYFRGGGYSALTPQENIVFERFYFRVSKHGELEKKSMVSLYLNTSVDRELNQVLTICQRRGQDTKIHNQNVHVNVMNEDVLRMNKKDFLKWVALDAKSEMLVEKKA